VSGADLTFNIIGAVGDLATAGAFVLAAVIYARGRADQRSAQAEQVAAWLALDVQVTHMARILTWRIYVRNGSDRPIHDVLFSPAQGQVDPQPIAVLPPGVTESEDVGDEITAGLEGSYGGGITIDFTDAAGQRWRRTEEGRLRHWRERDGQPYNAEVRARLAATERGEVPPTPHPPQD